MTVEKMYERTLNCVNMMGDFPNEKAFILKILKEGEKLKNEYNSFPIELSNLLIDLKQQMMAKEYRSNGRSGILKCAKFILSKSKKTATSYNRLDKSAIINDVQIISNGHIVLFLDNHIDLPKLNDDEDDAVFKRIYDNYFIYTNENIKDEKELTLPSIGELKAYISEQKAQNVTKIFWDFGENLPMVDTMYLLKILEIKQNVKMYYNTETTGLVFAFDDGKGLVMPIRKPEGVK